MKRGARINTEGKVQSGVSQRTVVFSIIGNYCGERICAIRRPLCFTLRAANTTFYNVVSCEWNQYASMRQVGAKHHIHTDTPGIPKDPVFSKRDMGLRSQSNGMMMESLG